MHWRDPQRPETPLAVRQFTVSVTSIWTAFAGALDRTDGGCGGAVVNPINQVRSESDLRTGSQPLAGGLPQPACLAAAGSGLHRLWLRRDRGSSRYLSARTEQHHLPVLSPEQCPMAY
jgi:hypothetical protein